MKLMHYLFSDPIEFDDNRLQQLVFENPRDMGIMVKELYEQTRGYSGRFVLYDGVKDLNIARDVILIDSPIGLDRFDKPILQGVLTKSIDTLKGPDFQLETYSLMASLESLIGRAMLDVDDSLHSEGIDISRMIKTMDLELIHKNNVSEDIMESCDMIFKYTNTKMIAVCNLSTYIENTEFENLLKGLAYLNSPILIIDRIHLNAYPSKLFDEDFCEINLKNGSANIFEV